MVTISTEMQSLPSQKKLEKNALDNITGQIETKKKNG